MVQAAVYFKRMRFFWVGAILSGILFAILFGLRTRVFNTKTVDPFSIPLSSNTIVPERDTWKNIFQNDRKIGSAHSRLSKTPNGYQLLETLTLRVNIMGMLQDISLKTTASLYPDFSLAAFDFKIGSGRFQFSAKGTVSDHLLTIISQSAGSTQKNTIRLDQKLYLAAGLVSAVMASGFDKNKALTLFILDPTTMSRQPVDIRLLGKEDIHVMGNSQAARKVSISFKGATQLAWIADDGEILREQGLLGISLEKTSQSEALSGLALETGEDFTLAASIPANLHIESPDRLERLSLKIDGIGSSNIDLNGDRQSFRQNRLTIARESLNGFSKDPLPEATAESLAEYLKPSLFIQSNDPKIKNLADSITSAADPPWEKARKLTLWVFREIEKRPVLSLPDALSTLENRMGDCNEHTMLLAALLRAAGIPARIEAGLVYLNGRFYYHAWNGFHVGKWITADAVMGQLPADITHVRLASGAHSMPIDIMGVIGKIQLEILEP